MGLLDGEIAELVATNLIDAGLSLPATLIKVTAGARDPLHPTAATPETTVSHTAQGFVAKLEPYLIRDTLIANVTRVVKLYGASIAGGAIPAPRDRITIEGVTSVIVDDDAGLKAVQRDPARAVYTCQCR
jgi:hypothetical protein